MIIHHEESSFDIGKADDNKVPEGYGSHFKSYDGVERTFLAESNGGPGWVTEYNVLAWLSSRSFGPVAYFLTPIPLGRVDRGLALSPRRCGFTTLLPPSAFLVLISMRSFLTT